MQNCKYGAMVLAFMLCYVMCYVMLCYVMLCYVMLCYVTFISFPLPVSGIGYLLFFVVFIVYYSIWCLRQDA